MAELSDIAFLGRASEELSDLIDQQTAALFAERGIVVPVRSCSVLLTIARHGPVTITELSDRLGRSRQLILQKLPKLVRLGLISQAQDEHDARRKLIAVSAAGHAQIALLTRCMADIECGYAKLIADVGDVHGHIIKAIASLHETPMAERIR